MRCFACVVACLCLLGLVFGVVITFVFVVWQCVCVGIYVSLGVLLMVLDCCLVVVGTLLVWG